ncbi:putative serine protease K12H4.7 [Teleopsis dalmanni]|uniref:putative serine protease K12H4.7 n=1 Tax=Teleopsis dalmanni TaxID=139649 RepID=UPI0018CE3630|nr:putative serine protease K12H4.7 [Teleopsis dalmanni]
MATAILLIFLVMQANAVRIINPNRKILQEPPLLLPKDRSQHEVKEHWLEQRLDHFDGNNNQTWQMRYFQNDKYYEAGAPLFIFIGGEWEISKAYLLTGHFYDIALQHHAMLYYVEHRFYGKSIPENDTSLENLKYLNIKQALADLNIFITTQKQSRNSMTNSKVILAGGSYAGSIVAWFQKIYPGLATAGWASSAPLFAKMDFYEYMIIAGESIKRKGGSTCYKRIKTGMEALAAQFKLNASDEIIHKLMVCDNFDTMNPLDIEAFFNTVGYYFSEVVQSYR